VHVRTGTRVVGGMSDGIALHLIRPCTLNLTTPIGDALVVLLLIIHCTNPNASYGTRWWYLD